MFAPSSQSQLISIENQFNQSYSPNAQTNPADFGGDWDFRKAYRIKALEPVSIEVCGEKADPDTPIPFVAETAQGIPVNNWIAYLKDDPNLVGNLFSPTATPDIFRVWNLPTNSSGTLSPQSYSVTLQGGTNFAMSATNGYILNASADGEFTYGFAAGQVDDRTAEFPPLTVENGCEKFITPFQPTLQTATVILPKTVLEQVFSKGDEIGVFARDGSLCGSGKFSEYGISMVVSGDESGTMDYVEGFAEGETMTFRLWKKAEGKVFDVAVSFQNGSPVFENEAVYFATGIEILQVSAAQSAISEMAWAVYPNPATSMAFIDLRLPETSVFNVEWLASDGQPTALNFNGNAPAGLSRFPMDVSRLNVGFYFIKLTTKLGVSVRKIAIAR